MNAYLRGDSELQAFLRIDEGPQLSLQVDRTKQQVKGNTGVLNPGVYEIKVEYFIRHPELQILIRDATGATEIEIHQNRSVAVNIKQYFYFDDDGDASGT
ncbi:MAG: hypothetical protein OEZ58_09780 [Gammaproteobacteria bacterium]|nr:hypothetical protein [Gammaproteobacteria bacterium]MDH5729268.1 hypothetical protein [Gammaproteobacteria bacterium]